MLVQMAVGGPEQRNGLLACSITLLLAWILFAQFDDKHENWILACRASEAFTIMHSTDGRCVNFNS